MPVMSVKAKARIAAMLIAALFTVITPLPLQRMFGARIRRKAVPYVTTEIAGEMELFPAPKWPSPTLKCTCTYSVPNNWLVSD
jgi:hypothetical protein